MKASPLSAEQGVFLVNALHLVFPSATLNRVISLQLANKEGKQPKTAVLKAGCSFVTQPLHSGECFLNQGCKVPGAEMLLPTAFQHDYQGPDAMVVMWACILLCVCICVWW